MIKYGLIADVELWEILKRLDGSTDSILENAEKDYLSFLQCEASDCC